MHERIKVQSVETRSSWIVAVVVLAILALSFGAPWIIIVALKAIATETEGLRSVPALANSLAWVGFGAGGIVMGYVAERVGVRWTVRELTETSRSAMISLVWNIGSFSDS